VSRPDLPPPGTVVPADDEGLRLAVEVLRRGGLVAVPTETVYGLAADARDPQAVARVFAAKGRPADHPLIVHLPPEDDLAGWATEVPDEARVLGGAFWPGPLTMVLPRHRSVPLAVTGGRDTVALRKPAHAVARRVLESFGGGLAAPSANRFGRVSPTTADDVRADLGDAVDLVLDGGRCDVGVESTIVELDGAAVRVLRPGGLPHEALEEVLGRSVDLDAGGPSRAPGMLASHYAPRTPVELHTADSARRRAVELLDAGRRVAVLALDPLGLPPGVETWDAGGDVAAYAHQLYRWLRRADAEGLDALVAVPPPPAGVGVAVADRLRRAATR
jgi:L-threonylcarbamoyladenylate synthase